MKIITIRNFFIVIFLLASIHFVNAQIFINEIMQSNVTCIMDDLNDFPDSWVELYNTSTEAINLEYFALGETQEYSDAYPLPAEEIPALGYKLIYLDKVGEGCHADFRLDSGKGCLWLFDNTGKSIDKVSYKKMPAFDVSLGRLCGDFDNWGYQLEPSPGEANTSYQGASVIDVCPLFDIEGGLYEESFTLTISLPTDENTPSDALLAVSTDGSWPSSPIGRSVTIPINCTTSVRARIISNTHIDGPVITNSYIFHPEPTSLDVVSIVTDHDYLYSQTIGILEGWDGHTPYNSNNWRRPINIEYFSGQDHQRTINQISEVKVKGNWSRQFPQKSLALYANKRFGTKRFETTGIWPDKPNVTHVKSFELRNSGQRFIFDHLCDQFAHRIGGMGSKHLDWSAYRPVICYLNGEYYGIYDLRERCNEDNIEANYNGLEDIDMVTDWIELDTGDANAISDLQQDLGGEDISFESLCDAVDIDGFLEMFVLQWVLGNTDFPRHNIVSWRLKSGDRRWRWLLKDLDCIGVDGANGDYIHYVNVEMQNFTNIPFPQSGKAFYTVLNSTEGRDMLIPRLMIAMGDYLREDRAIAMLDEMAQEIAPEYRRHLNRFYPDSDKYTFDYWLNQVECRKNEIRGRENAIIGQLRQYYGYEQTFSLIIDRGEFPVCIEGQELRTPDFKGNWFFNLPLEINLSSTTSWQVKETDKSGNVTSYTLSSDELVLNVGDTEITRVEINPAKDDLISDVPFVCNNIHEIYSVSGILIRSETSEEKCLNNLTPGMYLYKKNGQTRKIIIK